MEALTIDTRNAAPTAGAGRIEAADLKPGPRALVELSAQCDHLAGAVTVGVVLNVT